MELERKEKFRNALSSTVLMRAKGSGSTLRAVAVSLAHSLEQTPAVMAASAFNPGSPFY